MTILVLRPCGCVVISSAVSRDAKVATRIYLRGRLDEVFLKLDFQGFLTLEYLRTELLSTLVFLATEIFLAPNFLITEIFLTLYFLRAGFFLALMFLAAEVGHFLT
jgi:hypothetical protein